MKVGLTLIAILVLLAIFGPGCGGGGGTTTTTTSTSTSTTGGNVIKYVVEATRSGATIDPTNIIQGETIQFVMAGYTDTDQRIVQSASNWQIDPTGQSEGSITSGGQFTATASGNGFTVSATVTGVQHSGPAQVKPAGQAVVFGRLIDGQGGILHGVEVDFYSGSGIVDSSISQGDGTFRASMPATAVTFEVNKNTIPNGDFLHPALPSYYKEYEYVVAHGTTTVTAGTGSATQHLASTTGIVPGYILHFAAENANRIVQSVTNSTTVVLTQSISSTTNETVTITSANWFLPGPNTNCMAPLPTLTNGLSVVLNSDVLVPPKVLNGVNYAPPPPPSSCGP